MGAVGQLKIDSVSSPLYQPHSLQTRMAALADDDVIVHGNPERIGDVDDRFGHLDVGVRRRRIAARDCAPQSRNSKKRTLRR